MILNMVLSRGGLNFSVNSYDSKSSLPTTASENDIAIITSTDITSWAMSATEPTSPSSGMVWILTGTVSTVEFNILNENAIQVYPLKALQYINNSWVNKKAKSYKNGAWVDWFDGVFYDNGDQCKAYTGGWTGTGWTNFNTTITNGTIGNTYMQIATNNDTVSVVGTVNKVDLTNISTLYANTQMITTGTAFFAICETKNAGNMIKYQQVNTINSYTMQLDVSNITGSYYIIFRGVGTSSGVNPMMKITKVWSD